MIELPAVARPEMTVVMVTYTGWPMVRAALEALVAQTPSVYEVVVVDNASPDGTGELVRTSVVGATLLPQDRNLGFGPAVDLAALHARAPVLALLNSDCIVQPGWYEPLRDRLAAEPALAAVSPTFLHPDASLQEHGSMLFADGSTLAVGDGADPGQPPFQVLVRPDYVSAACLLVRRAPFQALGGLGAGYDPAYYEDTDLQLRLRRAGLGVAVEPRSRVVHQRGGSSADAATLLLASRERFAHRWAEHLEPLGLPLESPTHVALRRHAGSLLRCLVIDDRLPLADRGSGDPRALEYVAALRRILPAASITMLATSPIEPERYAPALYDLDVEPVWSAVGQEPAWLAERFGLFDLVVISRPHNWERLAGPVRATQPRADVVYDAEAIYSRRIGGQVRLGGAGLLAGGALVAGSEWRAVVESDAITCVSDEELAAALALAPAGAIGAVVSHAVALDDGCEGLGGRSGVLFLGGFLAGAGSPNEDAAVVAARDLHPRLGPEADRPVLTILGADPTPVVEALAGPSVVVTGWVADVRTALRAARVHVAPLRFGAGIKIKLVESMACGLPFVTTSVGAEGLRLGELRRHLVADDVDGMAVLTRRLLADDALWLEVQAGLLEVVQRDHGAAGFDAAIASVLARLGLPVGAPGLAAVGDIAVDPRPVQALAAVVAAGVAAAGVSAS